MTLNVLAVDHFFDQDLVALEERPDLRIRRIPYQRLRRKAIQFLGRDVSRRLEDYTVPWREEGRRRYATWLERELGRMYREQPFDVVVLPSDSFFYVRALPAVAHGLGVPVVVVQKETVLSEDTMVEYSREVGQYAPFISDMMAVCSERHREFWLRTGASPEQFLVTGQPRFDVYARRALDLPQGDRRPRVLFLSYILDAYAPGVGQGMGLSTWRTLRDETEGVLWDAVRAGAVEEVVVKCHPQQSRRPEARRIQGIAGSLWGERVSVARGDADTRQLIIEADVVVGFQTTALYEAAAAGKPTIYAAWGEAYEAACATLLQFHTAPPGCVHHARGREELAGLLADPSPPSAEPTVLRGWFEEALGPVDGGACERVTAVLTSAVAGRSGSPAPRLEGATGRWCAGSLLVRSVVSEVTWLAALVVAGVFGEADRVRPRRTLARAERRLAVARLLGRPA
jgi:hypothetical protein